MFSSTRSTRCTLLKPTILIWLNAGPILLALKQDPEVARLAALPQIRNVRPSAYSFNCISRYVSLLIVY